MGVIEAETMEEMVDMAMVWPPSASQRKAVGVVTLGRGMGSAGGGFLLQHPSDRGQH